MAEIEMMVVTSENFSTILTKFFVYSINAFISEAIEMWKCEVNIVKRMCFYVLINDEA